MPYDESGTLMGLIHGLHDRARWRSTQAAKKNYMADPSDQNMQAVYQADPDEGEAFHRQQLEDQQATLTRNLAAQQRSLGAAQSISQGLYRVQQSGGDVGAAFDQVAPVLQRGFGLKDEDIAGWRQRLTSDPNAVTGMYRMLNQPPGSDKLYVTRPGGDVSDAFGDTIHHTPAAPKTMTIKRGDGGSDVYVMDEQGNYVQSGQASGVPGGAQTPGQAVTDAPRSVRNNNPGNIKDGPWARRQPGYSGTDGTFAQFASPDAGAAAHTSLLGSGYINGQRSTVQVIDKYLGFKPGVPNENSVATRNNYVDFMSRKLGLDPNAPIPANRLQEFAAAQREFEAGQGAPSTGSAETGGSGGAPHPVISTPAAPAKGWRDLTAEENKARGLDPSRRYQIGISGENTGKLQEVPGQVNATAAARAAGTLGPSGGKPGTLTVPAHFDAVTAATRYRDEAQRLLQHPAFNQATGPLAGRLPSVMPQSVEFDKDLQSFRDQTVIQTMTAMKNASRTGATGFGQLSEKEGARLENSKGALDQSSPENLRRTLSDGVRDATVTIGNLYNIPPEATIFLLQHPKLAPEFDKKFGKGMSRRIRGY
jgi:hypothetical protein